MDIMHWRERLSSTGMYGREYTRDIDAAIDELADWKISHAKLADEILSLHRQLAHEKLRADTGWQRYESANKAHMAALNVVADAENLSHKLAKLAYKMGHDDGKNGIIS